LNKALRRVLVLVLGAAAVGAGVYAYDRSVAARGSTVDTSAFYAQRLRDGVGTERNLADLRGRVVVVNFWATWCVPCVEEIPMFSKVHAEQDSVAFVGLGIDSPGNVTGFNARFKPSYPLLIAGASGTELARALGNASGALPFTVVLDRDGHVVQSHLGRVDEATLRAWIQPYLAKTR
jgi:thiol-disulfide isomerase/thioredoxin